MEISDHLILGRSPRKTFSQIGFACFVILALTMLLQLAANLIISEYAPLWTFKSWYIWAVTFIPMYIIAVPAGILLLKRVPAVKPEQHRISFGKLIIFLIMCICIMYIGNIIGAILSSVIGLATGTDNVNPLNSIIMDADIYLTVIFVVILAPIIEELIFRKLIIDRISPYGQGAAILVSALMFGLFHGNLYQFFYAFGLGAMFAYIYIKTGRLRYTIIFHMIINFMGSIIGPMLIKNLDLNALTQLDTTDTESVMNTLRDVLPQLLGFSLYVIAMLSLAIAGLVLLIVKRKSFVLETGSMQLEKGTGFKTIFINVGMLLFIAGTLGLFVYVLV